MMKLLIALLMVFSSALFTNGATAQNLPLACQGEASAGMDWENGRWVISRFQTTKFVLVQSGNTLTLESVAKALQTYPKQITCREGNPGKINCMDISGSSLFIDLQRLTGGIAHLFGASMTESKRDSVTVHAFSCTPF